MTVPEIKALVVQKAAKYGIDRDIALRQIERESGFNTHAVSRVGAKGLAQFTDATWKEWGNGGDPFDPEASLEAWGKYMQYLLKRFDNRYELALAAYNGGPNRQSLNTALNSGNWPENLPAETRLYLKKILGPQRVFPIKAAIFTVAAVAVVGYVISTGYQEGTAVSANIANLNRSVTMSERERAFAEISDGMSLGKIRELKTIAEPAQAEAPPAVAQPMPAEPAAVVAAPESQEVSSPVRRRCPVCGGQGGKRVTARGIWSTQSIWIRCPRCLGRGWVTD